MFRALWCCLCGLVMVSVSASAAPPPLRGFYVVSYFFSDDLSSSYDEILDVTQAGDDVRVRIIRLSAADRYCGGQLVRAVERLLPHTTVSQVAGRDLCAYRERRVEAMLTAAKPPNTIASIFDSTTLNVVAQCGTREKIFGFPYPEDVDLEKLKRIAPDLDALWDVKFHVRRLAFGDHFSLNGQPNQRALEDFGTTLLPELKSGKYRTGFLGTCHDDKNKAVDCKPDYLGWRLRNYTEAPKPRGLLPVAIVDVASLHLLKYDVPPYPQIALTARVFGDVRLRLTTDPQTGLVTNVEVLTAVPLLADAAADKARAWQFDPAFLDDRPIDVTLRFANRCAYE